MVLPQRTIELHQPPTLKTLFILDTNQNSALASSSQRLQSIDFLRGLIMVIMALDHVRDFFSNSFIDPTNLSKTTEGLFITRWITHYCAPNFVFLAGISAFLYGNKCRTKKELFLFLFTRGLWLIFLEHTAVRFGWLFNFDYSVMIGQVIWAIGFSMVVLSFLVFLGAEAVATVGILIMLFHNLLDGVKSDVFGSFGWLWKMLHAGGAVQVSPGFLVLFFYPVLPWVGVIATGYGFGTLFLKETSLRRKILLWTGAGLIAGFIAIRFTNAYGDSAHWSVQKDFLFTVFSFVNCTKYPPSLMYAAMTLGPAMLLLAFAERWQGAVVSFFVTIGRVPMLYYIAHVLLIHSLAVLVFYCQGVDIGYLFTNGGLWNGTRTNGFGLPGVYAIWLVVVVMLYPLCRWFAAVKKAHKDWWWLSYL